MYGMNSTSIKKRGWLRKSPPEKKLRKNAWRKRWFVLRSGRLTGDPNLLEYYKHEWSKKPVGSVVLDECTQIDANVPVKYDRKDPSQQFVFDIVTKSRTYYLVAKDSSEMSSWVRSLCDLCGFNHENSDRSSDLGNEQQTFRPNRRRIDQRENGVSPLLDHPEETALTDAPTPNPRPFQTLTNQSILIRNRGTNGQASGRESPAGQNLAGFSRLPKSDDSYVLAENQVNTTVPAPAPTGDVEYLHLKDFTTAHTSVEQPKILISPSTTNIMGERRPSTDSVFTHEGATNGNNNEAVHEQLSNQLRPPLRKTRLDSMPDCPPPPPPLKAPDQSRITKIDERNFSMIHNDFNDDDVVMESRKKSTQSPGLAPIDDSELIRVPLNLQHQFGVDDVGRRLPGSTASSRTAAHNTSSGNVTSEYINTADAATEVRFGTQSQHSMTTTPFSMGNKSASSMLTDSSVFFNSPVPQDHHRHPIYDSPSPMTSLYASPRSLAPHQSSLSSNKRSLCSSNNAISPFPCRGSPMLIQSAQASPHHAPRIRRSSSVGQLEKVANDLASQSVNRYAPSHNRRSSIDHRYNRPLYNPPSNPDILPYLATASQGRSDVPPPRPPKSEHTAQQVLRDISDFPSNLTQSSDYLNLSDCRELPPTPDSAPLSPPHTDISPSSPPHVDIAPSSPPHTEVVTVHPVSCDGTPEDNVEKSNSTIQGCADKDGDNLMNGSLRLSSSSSGVSSSSGGSSSGRSFTAAVFDVGSIHTREAHVANVYDTPRKLESELDSGKNIYDSPKPCAGISASIYDSPTNKAASVLLPDIDESQPSYEVMMDQTDLLPPSSDHFQPYTCMVGASALVSSPSFSKKSLSPSIARSSASSEAPPVNRDLKPGRRSLGSDGGMSDTGKYPYPRWSYDDRNDVSGNPSDPPVSPPYTAVMHTISSPVNPAATPIDTSPLPRLHDRLQPPDRPPKNPAYTPRVPVSASASGHLPGGGHFPGRYPMYGFDKTRHGQEILTPGVGIPLTKPKSAAPIVPDRPPKPDGMKPGASPSLREERSQSMRLNRGDFKWTPTPMAQRPVPPTDFVSTVHSNSMSGLVPPAPQDPSEKPLTYVELADLPKSNNNQTRANERHQPADRVAKSGDGVEYWVLDQGKTEALEKMKVERDKEKRAGAADLRSIKSGKF